MVLPAPGCATESAVIPDPQTCKEAAEEVTTGVVGVAFTTKGIVFFV